MCHEFPELSHEKCHDQDIQDAQKNSACLRYLDCLVLEHCTVLEHCPNPS